MAAASTSSAAVALRAHIILRVLHAQCFEEESRVGAGRVVVYEG